MHLLVHVVHKILDLVLTVDYVNALSVRVIPHTELSWYTLGEFNHFLLSIFKILSDEINRLILGYRIFLQRRLRWFERSQFWLVAQTVLELAERRKQPGTVRL